MANPQTVHRSADDRPQELRWIPILAGAFAVLVAVAATLAFLLAGDRDRSDRAEMFAGLGGDFELMAHTGERVSLSDFEGQTVLVYFGYTYCPDVCPIHLTLISAALERLDARSNRIQPLFVSVDPARDTPEAMAAYVQHFTPGLIGLTGTEEEIAQVARQYAVARQIVQDDALSDYTVNHSSVIYVINGEGRIVDVLSPDSTPEELAEQLRGIL